MSSTVRALRTTDREKTAERLLNSSADKFYDPDVDIDWSAPLVADKQFEPEHRISLYGTPLWDKLTPAQRRELGKHEIASVASNGVWFEVLLMQMLLKEIYRGDPTTKRVQYGLTEIADECRHSTMFGQFISRLGAPAYGPRPWLHRRAKLLPVLARGPVMYAAVLVVEEILDRLQREAMVDETVQPLVRMVSRIHVLEEARHVSFARQCILATVPKLSKLELAYQRWLLGFVAYQVTHTLVNPRVYAAVGLPPRATYAVAMRNPHYRESMRWAGERVVTFLRDAGMIGGPGMGWWRKSFLI